MTTSSKVRIDRSVLFGLLAYLGTFLLIPLWDIYALVYAIITGLRGRKDPKRAEEATAVIAQPLRRLIFIGLAFGLVFAGVGVSDQIIRQPGPFGFLATGISHLPDWAVKNGVIPADQCCENSLKLDPGTAVDVLIDRRIANSLRLLVGSTVAGGILTALLLAGALYIRQREMRVSVADGILLLVAVAQPVLVWPGIIPLEIGVGLLLLAVLGMVFLPDLNKRLKKGTLPFNLTYRRTQLDLLIHGVLRLLALRMTAIPLVGLGLMVVLFAGVRFHLIPAGGVGAFQPEGSLLLDRLRYLVGPAFAVAALPSLQAARAGYHAWVAWEQAGRPEKGRWGALGIAAARAFMEQVGWLISMLLIAETVFGYPGVAALLRDALQEQDGPMVIGLLAVFPLWMLIGRARAALLGGVERAYAFNAPEARPVAQTPPMRDDLLKDIEPRKLWLGLALLLVAFMAVSNIANEMRNPFGPEQRLAAAFQLPTNEHPMGTDELGRDIQARILEAQRVSFGVSLAAGLVALAFGGVWGGLALFASKIRGVYGESFADFLRLPAEAIMILHPALVALLFTVARSARTVAPGVTGQSLTAMGYLLGMAVVPRIVMGLDALWDNLPKDRSIQWRVVGTALVLLLGAMFAAWQYMVAISFLGYGVQFPFADPGSLLTGFQQYLGATAGGSATDARFYLLLSFFTVAAGWQSFTLYVLQDAVTGWFGIERRDFLPRLFG